VMNVCGEGDECKERDLEKRNSRSSIPENDRRPYEKYRNGNGNGNQVGDLDWSVVVVVVEL